MRALRFLILGFMLFSIIASGIAQAPAETANSKKIYKYVLDNGLEIIIKPIHRVPLVTTYLVYKVGSGYEPPEYFGASHFIEHLMFKGTHKLKKGDIDKITQRFGGENNA